VKLSEFYLWPVGI